MTGPPRTAWRYCLLSASQKLPAATSRASATPRPPGCIERPGGSAGV